MMSPKTAGKDVLESLRGSMPPEPMAEHRNRRRGSEATLAEKFQAKRNAWSKPHPSMKTTHRIYLGDAREMRGLTAGTQIHLVVTSPPYWNLKRYADDRGGNQLGHIGDREAFLDELGKVWRRCFDMLVPGGRMCVVVGDVCRSRRQHGRHVVEPLHAYLLVQGQNLGFDPLAPILWKKIANAKTEVAGNGAAFLGKPYEPNAIIKNDIEFILMFRKPGEYRHPTPEQRDLSVIEKQDYAAWFQQVWEDVPGELQREHPAPFPKEIARRLISMFSFVGDTVLDPFWGVGNTTLAAIETHRSSIGFEIEPAYIRAARKNLQLLPGYAQVNFYEP
jgi:site-specific DNA-methyltransferase (adenine-specific)